MFHITITCLKYLCAKYTFFFHIGEKRLGTSEDTRNPTPPKEGEIPTPQPEDVDSEVHKVVEIVTTTTGDVDVVCKYTSPRWRAGMVCNWEFEKIKENIHDVEKRQHH
ncbi:hypothetical protein AB205_0105470 [Aquarana catesbeiana]|nr:hypothetical protein AB205_0105470 [Aquarana catesbeiana]